MAKSSSTEIAKPSTSILVAQSDDLEKLQLPAHLQADSDAGMGLETVKKVLRPGRVKVIQDNRTQDFSEFTGGTVIITPMKQKIVDVDQPFHFVPLLLFMEWCTVNPIQTKGSLPMIRARSTDPGSEIARKARDPELRAKEPCPEKPEFKLKHKEYYVYLCVIVGNSALAGVPVVLSFSGGEHKQGTTLANLLGMRRGPRGAMPIFANVFEGRVPKQKRHAEGGDWYGINVGNPTDGTPPFVMDPADYETLKAKHLELKAMHEASLIDAGLEDEEGDRTDPAAEVKF